MAIRSVLPILFSAAFLLFGHGLNGILVPVRAEIEGFSPTAIGIIGTGFAIGFTLGCFIVPQFVRKVGHIRTFGALAALLSVAFLYQAIFVNPFAWFFARTLGGLCIAGTFMVLESWLNERTTNANRGSTFSIYMMITQLALLGGQYTLVIDSPETTTLFILGAMAFSLALLPTALTGIQSPAPLSHVSIDLRKLYSRSQIAVIGAFFSGVIASAWGSFAPIFGSQMGLSTASVASMMAVAMIGGTVFQYPIGRASDLMDRRYVMVACGLVGAIIGSMLYQVGSQGDHSIKFWILIFGFGSVLFTIYALFVAHANDYAEASEFVETSSGLLVVYGVGTMIGPLATAAMLETVGTGGMFAITTAAHLCIAIFAVWRVFVSTAPADLERDRFQAIGAARANTPQTYEFDPRSDEEQDD